MNKLSGKWRGFMAHLGPYLIVVTMLAIINLLTYSGEFWFLWPALGWGVAIAFHLFGILLSSSNLRGKWRGFVVHFGSYSIIISLLAIINLLTFSGTFWFLWPALGWGAAVAIHLWTVIMTGSRQNDHRREAISIAEYENKEEAIIQATPYETKLSNQTLQAHLDKAIAYKDQINGFIQATTNENSRNRLQELAAQVDDWIEAIKDLARRIDNFQQDSLIHQDLESVPQSIQDLENRLARETNPVTRTELEKVLANRKNQLASLKQLQTTMSRAELQIESTLSSLGTIYSQLLTGQSTDHVADYSRLSTDVDEEVRKLQDHLEALEEVKFGRM